MVPATIRKASSCRTTLLALLVVLSLIAPMPARAGAKENKERSAKTACLSGDYAKGVALLAELYVSTNDVTYLFNQGRCYEQNGKYEEAIIRFREYELKNADAGNPPDTQAQQHIANCQALLDKQKPAPAAPVEARVPVSTPAPVATVADPVEPVMVPIANAQTKAPVEGAESVSITPGRGLRIGGVSLAALGAVGIAVGVIFNLKANGLASDLEAANGSSATLYSRSKESSRSSYETAGWIAYGAGAACMAGGAILYYLGYSQSQSAQVAFVPTIAVGHVGAALQGAF